jgi:class 3 adenylate cyclase
VIVCAQCGRENPDGARFCNSCGAPLGTDGASSREVRKTVTVLFCDVVGSTALAERSDPEVMRDVMSRFYAAVREPVERNGGVVEKVIGDALMAVFGIPTMREDDALRALQAALEMRDAVREMGEIQARIGVNTGDVLARDPTQGESLVVGDAVNVAARLEQAAAPGDVLVGEATWALVGHAARGEQVAPIAAKGKREPLRAWRLEDVDPEARSHRRRLDLPMIGRDAELDLLRWALERTGRANRPHLVTVIGQPGIGKSRLVAELPRLGDGLTILTGQCRAITESSSLEPLLEVARAAVPDGRSVSEGIAEMMAGDQDAAAVAACLRRDAGAPDVAWAVSRLIGALAETRTVVVVLEDVHWASGLLLDIVEQLLGDSRRRALLVVCTARPELSDRRPAWGTGANTITLALERLDDPDTRRLLSYANPGLEAGQAERIVAAAEGNPLFAEHLAALVGDEAAAAGLPRSLQVLLAARLEALPQPEQEVVGVAAVAGRDFPAAAVRALVGRPVDDELDRLAQRELVEPTTSGWHRFGHALLQDAAYGLLPKARRSELHVQLAGWLDADGAGDAVVGDHLERAFRLQTELGLADDATARLGEEAGTRLAEAGRRADTMGDPRRARFLLERALDLLPERSPDRAAAMVELAAAGWNLLPKDDLNTLLADGADLAAELGARAVELRARVLRLGAVPETSSDAVTEREVIVQTNAALDELETMDAPRAVATSLCARSESEWWLGRAADGVASVRRAIDVLRDIDEDSVWALAILCSTVVDSPMPVSEAERLLAELMVELGVRPTVRSELIQGQAMLALLRGRDAEAWRLFDVALGIEQDLGRTRTWRLADHRRLMLLRAERFEEARTVLSPVIAELESRGMLASAAVSWSWLALAEVRVGNVVAAGIAAHTTLERVAGLEAYEATTRSHLVLSEVSLATADVDGAVASAREAVAIAGSGDWLILNAEARLVLARALGAAGDAEAAESHARAALDMFRAKEYVLGATAAEAFYRSLALAQRYR